MPSVLDLSIDELRVVYGGYVRPILEYADVVWHSSNAFKQSSNIESLFLGIHMIHMLMVWVEANLSLFERRENHCHRFAEGVPNNELTESLLSPSRFECHGRSLRS